MVTAVVTALSPRWEADIASRLGQIDDVHLVHRCADVADLLGAAEAGLGAVVLLSPDLRGMDRDVVGALRDRGYVIIGLHPVGDSASAQQLQRWSVTETANTDVTAEDLADLLTRSPLSDASHAEPTGPSQDSEREQHPAQYGSPAAQELIGSSIPALATAIGGEGAGSVTVPRGGTLVAVWGPTGAPGRSTVAILLASELAHRGEDVILVDADTYGATIAQSLGILDEAPGLAAAVRAASAGQLERHTIHRAAPEVSPGLRVMTGLPDPSRWPEYREHALADVLAVCVQSATWVVVDAGFNLEVDEELSFDTRAPRRNGSTVTILEQADQLVAVGRADPVGLQRLIRDVRALDEISAAPTTVVLNRVRSSAVGADPKARLRHTLQRYAGVTDPVLLPEDRASCDAAELAGSTLREIKPRGGLVTAAGELLRAVGCARGTGSGDKSI